MFCTKCGNQIDPNSKFCNNCGNSINGDESVEEMPKEKNKVSFLKCFLQAFLIGILLFIVPYFIIIIFNVLGIFTYDSIVYKILSFLQIIGSMFMILFGPIILYVIRVAKTK